MEENKEDIEKKQNEFVTIEGKPQVTTKTSSDKYGHRTTSSVSIFIPDTSVHRKDSVRIANKWKN